MARLKTYITDQTYNDFRDRYLECVRMLNGLQRKLESLLPQEARKWSPQSAPDSDNPNSMS